MPYSDINKFPLGNIVPDLAGMSLPAAVRMAISFSGKSDDDIAAAMHWGKSQSNRFFHSMDYWPSLPNIPRLCEVLGNTIIARWIVDNADFLVLRVPPTDAPALFRQLRDMLKEMSGLMDEAQKAMEDGVISGLEARRIIHDLTGLFRAGAAMLAGLQARLDHDKNGA